MQERRLFQHFRRLVLADLADLDGEQLVTFLTDCRESNFKDDCPLASVLQYFE
jgi:hypothetical protein